MFVLPPLPYDHEALAPLMSGETLRTHHGKHHAKYVEVTNALLAARGERPESLEAVVRSADGKLYNNAAQAWNHAFFWNCMTPDRAAPSGALAEAIATFGGLEALKARFVEEGANHFASGWAWIVARDGSLEVTSTHDAGSFDQLQGAPVLVCDVWEHAYYLDHKQDRKAFLERWFDELANWEFAGRQLAGEAWRYPPPAA